MSCDVCGDNNHELIALTSTYATSEIKQVCPACEKKINARLWRIRRSNPILLKRYMMKLRAKPIDKWWSRWMK